MSEIETLQTFFLGIITIVTSVGTGFGLFMLKKMGCFDNLFRSHGERIAKLETKAEIYHPKSAV
ncbi:MAG: hypothetical protein COA77_02500 [Thaumarchaeota archaeon]|nr:MAG: hypothetical protein COA77_02500 [Nitrososphaerota archaeon]